MKPRPDSPPQASVLRPLAARQQTTALFYCVSISPSQTMSPLLSGILLWSSILSGENHQFCYSRHTWVQRLSYSSTGVNLAVTELAEVLSPVGRFYLLAKFISPLTYGVVGVLFFIQDRLNPN